MMRNAVIVLVGVVLLSVFVAPIQANSSLPDAVPDDFPFPEDASLRVQDSTSASMIQVVVAFSFESDLQVLYSRFRNYVVDAGYEISIEDETERSFSSTDYPSGKSIGVRMSEMGSVNVGTVTFSGPNN